MGKKPAWVKVYAIPDPEVIEELCQMGIYYNGKGYYLCEDQGTADAALIFMRSRGHEAARSKGPGTRKFTIGEVFAVGRSLSPPERFRIF